jgi:aspartate/tyrosine/aromatic aminotransferase
MVRELLFGAEHEIVKAGRAVTAQCPGGTGALRVAADFLGNKFAGRTVWLSQPTWPNHPNIFKAAGLHVQTYPYIDASGLALDFEGLLAGLAAAQKGDIVCLHACCHNPTGVDPTPAQWKQIGDVVAQRELLPLVDFAYQGFGDGLREDAAGLLELARPGQELLVCSSFSKNFGVYSERVGALTIVATAPEAAEAALSHVRSAIRTNYSNPPQHGAAIVSTVLGDKQLRQMWEEELASMRERIHRMREAFVAKMKERGAKRDFSFLAQQKGMFSYSGLTPLQVDELKNKYSIYIVVTGGRINVAGMTDDNLDRLCDAICEVL